MSDLRSDERIPSPRKRQAVEIDAIACRTDHVIGLQRPCNTIGVADLQAHAPSAGFDLCDLCVGDNRHMSLDLVPHKPGRRRTEIASDDVDAEVLWHGVEHQRRVNAQHRLPARAQSGHRRLDPVEQRALTQG